MKKNKIPRSNDPILDAMIRTIEGARGKKVRQNYPQFMQKYPTQKFLALTHLSRRNRRSWARAGTINQEAYRPVRPDNYIAVESRVGEDHGTGLGFIAEEAPEHNGVRDLENNLKRLVLETSRDSAYNYHQNLGLGYIFEREKHMQKLIPTHPHNSIHEPPQFRFPNDRLRQIMKKGSRILSDHEYVKNSSLTIRAIDEARRYCNSEGTTILDSFYGFFMSFFVQILDSNGRRLEFFDYLTASHPSSLSVKAAEKKAKQLLNLAVERFDCPSIPSGQYDILFYPGPFSTKLHESIVHMIPSNEIIAIYDKSTILGVENFNEIVTNKFISIYSDPSLPHAWGSFMYDQEGILAKKKTLIEKGKLINYLADRHGAATLEELLLEERKIKAQILPGDSRTLIVDLDDNDIRYLNPLPRTSNLVVESHNIHSPHSGKDMIAYFHDHLKKRGKESGIIIENSGSYGHCFPESGLNQIFTTAGYLIKTGSHKKIPIKPIYISGTAHDFLSNIVMVGKQREYCPGFCSVSIEDGEDILNADVRVGTLTGSAIVKDVTVGYDKQPRHGY